MRIANVMFAPGQGGIEQAFLDYHDALLHAGHMPLMVYRAGSAITPEVQGRHATSLVLRSPHRHNPFTIMRLRRWLREQRVELAIAHGNRAADMLRYAAGGTIPLIGVTHNYSFVPQIRLGHVIALTGDLETKLRQQAGENPPQIYRMPNLVRMPETITPLPHHNPPYIVTMGRFVPKKGFDLLLEALAILRNRGVAFRCSIGGDGEQGDALRQMVQALDLTEQVTFTGWVTDKEAFFRDADIFCLPSRLEAFGIVLLEAMAAGRPVVSTRSEGPSEILTHGVDGLLTNTDAASLAEGLEALLADALRREPFAKAARLTVAERYSLPRVAERLDTILQQVTARGLPDSATGPI